MKKIRKEVLYETVKKAFLDGTKWCKADRRRFYAIMLDTADASIWCDVFLDEGDSEVYRSKSILNLTMLMPDFLVFQYVDSRDTKEAYCKCAEHYLKNAGWIIE